MGIFGGGNATTINKTSRKDIAFNNVDNRVGGGNGGIIGGNININASSSPTGNITIKPSDQGAIHAGLVATLKALDVGKSNLQNSLGFVQKANTQSLALAGAASKNDVTSTVNNIFKYFTLIILGGGVMFIVYKKIK